MHQKSKLHFYELRLARGPLQIGQSGNQSYNALLGAVYALWLNQSGVWKLERFTGVNWEQVSDPVLSILPPYARHIAFCYDQVARPVVAYEQNENVYVTQYDAVAGNYVVRGPFAGVDPVLIWDYEVGYNLPDSDVLLLHLSIDRQQILMRVQRELYNTPHTVQTLAAPAYLDQAVALPYRAEVLGSYQSDPNTTGIILRTGPYPVHAEETSYGAATLSAPTTGALIPLIFIYDAGLDSIGTATLSAPTTGALIPLIFIYDSGPDSIGTATLSAPTTGNYQLVVAVVDLTSPQYTPLGYDGYGTATLSAPTTGSYGP